MFSPMNSFFVNLKKIAINIVRELKIASGRGQLVIFNDVDIFSLWVEIIPLKCLTVEDIADGLLSIFCCMDVPDVTLADNGTQFVFRTMRSFAECRQSLRRSVFVITHDGIGG